MQSWLIRKDSDAGRDWGQEEKGTTEDEMAAWHHWLDGRESEWTPAIGDGQGGLACCDSWGCKESDTTERLNWTELNWISFLKVVKVLVAQSCLTLCDPMDCRPLGFSFHRILQARILEWVAIPFFGGSSGPRNQTQVSCIGRQILCCLSHQGSPITFLPYPKPTTPHSFPILLSNDLVW